MGWGGADGTCRYADVTLMEHVATLAHVVSVGEHRLDVTLIKYVATFALL